MQELQALKQEVVLAPKNYTNGATATANLDTKGHESVEIVVAIGAFAGGTDGNSPATIKLGEADDTNSSSFADISGASANDALTAGGSVRFFVDLRKRKRYLKLTFAPAANDTNDAVPVCAIAEFDRSREFPASTATGEMGNTIVKIV